MRYGIAITLIGLLAAAAVGEGPEPIKTVAVGDQAEFRVNGKPFFPIMTWLQNPSHFDANKAAGINTIAGYSGKADGIVAYSRKLKDAGFYFVASYHGDMTEAIGKELATSDHLLGWIHADEADMARRVKVASAKAGPGMTVNAKNPFSRLVDGSKRGWCALQPLKGGSFVVTMDRPRPIRSVGLVLTVSGKLPVARTVVVSAGGKEVARGELARSSRLQKVELSTPLSTKELTFTATELTFTVVDVHPGEGGWGAIAEVEAYDAGGKNVLISNEYRPRMPLAEVAARRAKIRAIDKTRPVFMTFTASFMKTHRGKYDEAAQKRIYPAYAKHGEVIGFDTYPIFGSAHFNRLADPGIGVSDLRELVGPKKALYSWIETNRGSKWMTPSKQPAVLPKHTRFETWAAVIRGATAIGYFTHKWFDPDGKANYSQFAPKEDKAMMAELARLNGQITRLTGPVLSPPEAGIKMTAAGRACHFKATRAADGSVWIFAQNMDLGAGAEKLGQFEPITPRAAKATFRVSGLIKGAKIEVVDESRTITAGDESFTDDFAPLNEHVYRIDPKSRPAGG